MRRSERIRKLGTDSAVKGYEYTGARGEKNRANHATMVVIMCGGRQNAVKIRPCRGMPCYLS